LREIIGRLAGRRACWWIMLTIRDSQIAAMSSALGQPAVMPCRTWIAIWLVDEYDNPVPNESYRITLPDGSTVEGTVDSDGHARHDGINFGQCTVTFPNLDQTMWRYDSSGPDQ
jgi:hypothetical protein